MPRISGSSTVEGVLVDWSLDQPVELPGLPVELLSREQAAAELERRQRRQALDAAYEAELILRLADLTPDDADPVPGSPGARTPGWTAERDVAGVSEFFAGESALVLNRGRGTAHHLLHRAQVWRTNLPATYRALSAGELDLARAAALADVLGSTSAQLARAVEAGRPIAAIGTELFSLLLRRPGGHGQPGVAAHLSITAALDSLAGGAARAGTVNGLPITAVHARELLARIGTLGLTDAAGRLLATTTVAELLRVAAKGCAGHPGQDCGCPVLGAPADTGTYRPTDRQQTFIRTRDRTCRMPGCGQRVGWADLDHVVAHGCGGGTSCTNLCCLCRTDHRLKTFARGWQSVMDPDGTLHVTTPSGITRTTRPPGLRRPPPEPPPAEPDDEPPPF